MKSWPLDILACPAGDCGGRLRAEDGVFEGRIDEEGLLRCDDCGASYPVLSGVPILTPDPGAWLASYRESVLAALVEHGTVTRRTIHLIESFTADRLGADPLRFGDDWLTAERGTTTVLAPPAGDGPSVDAYRAFLERAQTAGPSAALLALLGDSVPGPILEIGPGAGVLTRSLAARAPRLLVCDLSLRAVLLSLEQTGERSGAVAGAVVQAETLRLHPGTVPVVVAANVIDLLDDPQAFLTRVAEGLGSNGRFALCTPDPDLGFPPGGGAPTALECALTAAGLDVLVERDGIPWIRARGPRRHEVYFVHAILARRARGAG